MAKQLNTGTLESHPPTIIMVGSGNRQHIRSGAGIERRMETGTEGVTIVGRRADREADGAAGGQPIKHGNIGKPPSIYNSNSEEHNNNCKQSEGGGFAAPHILNKSINVGRLRRTTIQFKTANKYGFYRSTIVPFPRQTADTNLHHIRLITVENPSVWPMRSDCLGCNLGQGSY
jgi:hypothetical protein